MTDESADVVTDNVGKMLMAGFEGFELTPDSQGYKLIKNYRVHSFILGTKNFVNAPQMKALIQSLQDLAKSENYDHPLLIAVDQELGCCNSMYDGDWLTQFPGAMGLGATDDLDLIFKVGEAAGQELSSLGFSLYMGPVLDIVPRMASQLIGIRSFGSTVEDVTKYAGAFARGLKSGGMLTCAKHFPGMGTSFVDNLLELPMMLETFQQLETSHVLPFKYLMKEGIIDAVHASGVAVPNIAPNEIHACLSPQIVHKLLRKESNFDGLVMSECLELEALCRNIGLGQGAVMSILYARCDMAMVCNDFLYQKEALDSIRKAYESASYELIFAESLVRINRVLSRLHWTPEVVMTPKLLEIHKQLSVQAYKESITLIRDNEEALPITKHFGSRDNNILLLTPLLTEIHPNAHHASMHNPQERRLMPGEDVFQDFGERLANYNKALNYDVLHTSYTANGLTSMHEALIDSSRAVILVCAEASRNMYQIGVAKHVGVLCGGYKKLNGFMKKPLIIIAVTTPYDFLYHKGIGSAYLCTYDYTWNALSHLPAILFGDLQPTGRIPGNTNSADDQQESSPSTNSTPVNSSGNSLGMILNDAPRTALFSDPEDRKQIPPPVIQDGEVSSGSIGSVPPQTVTADTTPSPAPVNQTFAAFRNNNTYNSNGHRNSLEVHRRKRKKLNKPWLVEDFDISRDFTNLVLLLKNSWGSDLEEPLNPKMLDSLRHLLQETEETSRHFVVRNSTINILHGAIFTWVDKDSVNGRIMFIIVDKTKRRQSIAEVLHQHAIKYLTISRGCKTITLGTDFPLFNFLKAPITHELFANWSSPDPVQGGKAKLSNSALQIINFFRSVGWSSSRNKETRPQPIKKYILSLDMEKWMVSEKLVKQLKVLGIKFEIAEDHKEIIDLIRKNNFKAGDDESRFLEIYTTASAYIAQENKKQLKNTLIFKMIEPTSKTLIGSIILYNIKSKLANWFPFVEGAPRDKNGTMSCLTGVLVDSSYEALKPVMKLGLICTGVSFAKQFRVDTVILDNCCENEISELLDSGFEVYREYFSSLGIKMSYEWVV
ncbi:DEKNAAC100075 [Brettanomyces naardenensis]|uniref:DEKNAAC100075 n=1 Tax=Brettanomyces naardenensis TaxID=13370 RepID=A0A448YFA1_BRENA|nr:DEKNAAC100075 [Brettanomyces naardenensis]